MSDIIMVVCPDCGTQNDLDAVSHQGVCASCRRTLPVQRASEESDEESNDDRAVGIEHGIYLATDSPRSFVPLALEGGAGDKELLAAALDGILTPDELAEVREAMRGGE